MAEKLGVAIEVGSTYVLVEKGPILPADLYVPLAHVSSAGGGAAEAPGRACVEDVTSPVSGLWQRPR